MNVLCSRNNIYCDNLQLYAVLDRCKFSNEELRNASFIVSHRNDARTENPMQSVKQAFCQLGGENDRYLRMRMTELLKYWGDADSLQKFGEWRAPDIPVNGRDLLELGVARGPAMSWIIEQLRSEFAWNDFAQSRDELLQVARTLKEKAATMTFKNNKRKKSREREPRKR